MHVTVFTLPLNQRMARDQFGKCCGVSLLFGPDYGIAQVK
jgi:hypothetical protein